MGENVKYTIYASQSYGNSPRVAKDGDWLVRVYRNDDHLHSAEGGVPLGVGLREAERAIAEDSVRSDAF